MEREKKAETQNENEKCELTYKNYSKNRMIFSD